MNNNIPEINRKFKAVLLTLPAKVGAVMLDFTSKRFRQQNWYDTAPIPWHPRKTKKGKGNDATRALLVKSGRLKRASKITRLTPNSATIGNDTPYAKVHNEGINSTVQVKAHSRKMFKKTSVKEDGKRAKKVSTLTGSVQVKAYSKKMRMAKRQFIGNSFELNHQIERLMKFEILKIFGNGTTN